jgi:hypothetical protein
MLTRTEVICMVKHNFIESQVCGGVVCGSLPRVERNGIWTFIRSYGAEDAHRISLKSCYMCISQEPQDYSGCKMTCPMELSISIVMDNFCFLVLTVNFRVALAL